MGCERHHQGAAPQPAGCRRTLLGVGVGVGVGLGLGLGLGLAVVLDEEEVGHEQIRGAHGEERGEAGHG